MNVRSNKTMQMLRVILHMCIWFVADVKTNKKECYYYSIKSQWFLQLMIK